MTREEAIKNIKEHCYFANLVQPGKEALDMAISDMEKQIPKKPEAINWEQYVGIRNAKYLRNRSWCPNCGTDISSGQYCSTCGQLLDWSDEK